MNRRRVYIDFEFWEQGGGRPIVPISVGMVDEEGKEYYAVFAEIAEPGVWDGIVTHDFLSRSVVPHLPVYDFDGPERGSGVALDTLHPDVKPSERIRYEILDFLVPTHPHYDESDPVDLWAYFAAFDHVVLSGVFGTMMGLPSGIPMRTNDLAQEADRLGVTILPAHPGTPHHALHDARHDKLIGEFLAAQNEAWLEEYHRKRRREEDGRLIVVPGSATVRTTVLMPEGSVPEDSRRINVYNAVPVATMGDELHEYDIRYLSAKMEDHRRQIMAELRKITGTSPWDGEVKSPEPTLDDLRGGLFEPGNGD